MRKRYLSIAGICGLIVILSAMTLALTQRTR